MKDKNRNKVLSFYFLIIFLLYLFLANEINGLIASLGLVRNIV